MLKLIAKLLLFALLIAVSMQVIFVGARRLENRYYDDSSYAWVNHLSVKPKIVILGSSTALYNLSSGELCARLNLSSGEVVNLGGIQRSAISMYHVWKTIAPNRDSVKIVLASVDPWIAYQSYDWYQEFPTLYWTPWQRIYSVMDSDCPRFVLSGMIVTEVVKRSVRESVFGSASSIYAPSDFGSAVMQLHVKNFKNHALEYFGETEAYPTPDLYLARMAVLKRSVEQQGGTFILLLPPKQRVWMDEYRTNCRAIDSDFVSHLNAALGPTRVIGSFAEFPADADQTLFMDHDHLSLEGQRRFSDSVAAHLPEVLGSQPKPLRSLASY